jgi:hypothetical protein
MTVIREAPVPAGTTGSRGEPAREPGGPVR